uniref:Taste receptor type 2 n=1 Tax=Nannospalax galili TaxID=1026970 RepID=A0A0N7FXR3_NANGA|nr:taste receptor type 2 member 7 [Nannospalax galili]
MLSTAESILLCVVTTESVLGVLGNGFIGLVNCIDWIRSKKFSKINFILTGLVISRIFLIWILISKAYVKTLSSQPLDYGNLVEFMNYIWVIVNHMNIWFATSLSIFYFFKIANFSNYIFLWLKRKIDVIFILLIGCLFASWLIAVSQIAKIINNAKAQYRNTSWQVQLWKSVFFINHASVNIGAILFFTVALITCFLLIISLWRHKRRMESAFSGLRDLNSEAHVKAIKVLISFLILLVLYFTGISLDTFYAFMPASKLLFLSGLTTASLYPCCHSFVLILADRKLKQVSLRILQQLKCHEEEDLRAV